MSCSGSYSCCKILQIYIKNLGFEKLISFSSVFMPIYLDSTISKSSHKSSSPRNNNYYFDSQRITYCKLFFNIISLCSSPEVLSGQTKNGAILGLKKCTAMKRMLQYGMICYGDNILKIPYIPYN